MTNEIKKIQELLNSIEGNDTQKSAITTLLEKISTANTQKAISQLSYTELEAAKIIFANKLQEQNIVASKIADDNNITKSIIVNTLKKLESGGAIVSRSMGVKGMNVKVIDEKLFDILQEL